MLNEEKLAEQLLDEIKVLVRRYSSEDLEKNIIEKLNNIIKIILTSE
jgi:hypothetical protein